MKIKLFSCEHSQDVEAQVNDFLQSHPDIIIHNIEHRTVNRVNIAGVQYTVMVVYEVE